jgi:hypothetical protein
VRTGAAHTLRNKADDRGGEGWGEGMKRQTSSNPNNEANFLLLCRGKTVNIK